MAEVVHDMAPEATLRLVCIDTDLDFVAAAEALPSTVKVVNASIGNPLFGRGDGSGLIGDALRQSRLDGKLWSVAAGNSGDGHYNLTGTTVNGLGSVLLGPNNPVYSINVPDGGIAFVDLKWDAWPTTSQDFDLFVYESQAGYESFQPIAGSTDPQDGTQPPVESLGFANNSGSARTFLVEIYAFDGNPRGRRFDLFFEGNINALEAVTPGSLSEPATSPYAMTVGAYDVADGALEPFSSLGPTIDQRVKPDMAAPDGVSTATYGDGDFFGTSAAAPHVAGAAAVLLEANGDLDVAELQAILEARAQDPSDVADEAGAHSIDNGFGAGQLRVGDVATPQPPTGDLYVGVDPPVRVIDTRLPSGCGLSPCGALGPGATRNFAVAGEPFGEITVPVDASAVVFNVTAVSPTATGFVTVFPTGQARPNVANLNTRPGDTRPNHVTATVGAGGQVSMYNAAGNTHLVFDLAGYYSPTGDVGLVPLNPPGRAMDTRIAGGAFGPGESRALSLAGETIGRTPIPESARAVVLNVTVTPNGRPGVRHRMAGWRAASRGEP